LLRGSVDPLIGRLDADGACQRIVRASDLILLKLYAGGSQDAWDIEQLLAAGDRETLVVAVNAELDSLPGDARARWRRIAG
jgi:hypothetical protein